VLTCFIFAGMRGIIPVERGKTYHLFNRGINGENIFIEERNYNYFLKRWEDLVTPVVHTYAYCLLRNHFHFLLCIKDEQVIEEDEFTGKEKILDPANQLAKFFNSYAQSINKAYGRTGSLFEHPFHRNLVENDVYFTRLVSYIHFNPQKHGFVEDYHDWKYSSYGILMNEHPTFINRKAVNQKFGGQENYLASHEIQNDFSTISQSEDF
jgi:putative transposase